MNQLRIKRLNKEYLQLQKEPIEGIKIVNNEDLAHWIVIINGPVGTPFEGGIFEVRMDFHDDYPIKAPSVKFLTEIYHPNIYRDGFVCINILQDEWTPAQSIGTIMLSIISLLMDPNPNSPANREASDLFVRDKNSYYKKVRELISKQKNKN